MEDNFYQFTARSLQGKEISMESYRGKVILVVNTASKCGLTPQYEGLEIESILKFLADFEECFKFLPIDKEIKRLPK